MGVCPLELLRARAPRAQPNDCASAAGDYGAARTNSCSFAGHRTVGPKRSPLLSGLSAACACWAARFGSGAAPALSVDAASDGRLTESHDNISLSFVCESAQLVIGLPAHRR